MQGVERIPGGCDYSVVLKNTAQRVNCIPQLNKGFKEKGDCARCPKSRIQRPKGIVSENKMGVLPRERDIRNRRMNY